jgi:hypothetical protein
MFALINKPTERTTTMQPDKDTRRLRAVLSLDAAICAGFGLVCVAGAGTIAEFTALPRDLLLYAGLSLFPIALFMALVARQARPPRQLVWLVVLGNEGWMLGSVAILVTGLVEPNMLGYAFVIAQALAVAPMTLLEYQGLRRLPATAAA